MRRDKSKKLHDVLTATLVCCWMNWVVFGFVVSLFFGGYKPNSVLSQPQQSIYIVSKRSKTAVVSAQRYKFQSFYGVATWTLWWFSWPLLLASHLIGKRLDSEEKPESREDFLERLEKEEF